MKSEDPLRRAALGVLVTVHVLGVLGAPYAASLHLYQEGASAHQNFHVVWEAFKYASASLLAVAVTLGPLAEGRRWAAWVMGVITLMLFGGVFVSHAMTGGGPTIDFVAYGTFLVVSIIALVVVVARPPRWSGSPRAARRPQMHQ